MATSKKPAVKKKTSTKKAVAKKATKPLAKKEGSVLSSVVKGHKFNKIKVQLTFTLIFDDPIVGLSALGYPLNPLEMVMGAMRGTSLTDPQLERITVAAGANLKADLVR